MEKFNNEWYSKGYNDGFSDAINNLGLDDILEKITTLPEEDKQKVIEAARSRQHD